MIWDAVSLAGAILAGTGILMLIIAALDKKE